VKESTLVVNYCHLLLNLVPGKACLLLKRRVFKTVSSLSRWEFDGNCSMVRWALDTRL
jgi:hypothetical protein